MAFFRHQVLTLSYILCSKRIKRNGNKRSHRNPIGDGRIILKPFLESHREF